MRASGATASTAPALSLRANFINTLVGNVCYVACQCGQLVVLGHLGGPELVGQYALALAVTAPLIGLANLQLSTVQSTDTGRRYAFADYLAVRLLTSCLALAAIAIAGAASGYRAEQIAIIIAVGLAKAVEAISEVVYGLFQQRERMVYTSRSMILKGLLALAALGGGLWLSGSLLAAVVLMALVWGLLVIGYDLPNARAVLAIGGSRRIPVAASGPVSLWTKFRPAVLWKLAKSSLPLGISTLLASLTVNVPRYVIESSCGVEVLGVYAGCANILAGMVLLQVALGNATLPRLASYYQRGETRNYWSLAGKIAACAAAVGVANILIAHLFGRQVLTLLFSPEFANFESLFVWMAALTAVQCQSAMLGFLLSTRRRFNAIALVSCVNLAITAGSCAWLVQGFGFFGVVFGQLLGALAAIALFALYLVRPHDRVKSVLPLA